MLSFGQRLRKARKDKGLNQAELAKILGFKAGGSVSNIEHDKTPLSIQTLAKITDVLNVDLHWLITGQAAFNKNFYKLPQPCKASRAWHRRVHL